MRKQFQVFIECDLKLIELEFSLRQVFYIKQMLEKIQRELVPLQQVITHY